MGAGEDSHSFPGFWTLSRWLKCPMIRFFLPSARLFTLKSVSWICKMNLGPRNSKFRWRRTPSACTSCIRVGFHWGSIAPRMSTFFYHPPYECRSFLIFDDYELSSSLDETDSRLQNHSETNDSDRACVHRLPWRNLSRWLADPPPPMFKHHHPLFQVVSLRVNPASCLPRRVPFRWTTITARGHDGVHRSQFAIKLSSPWNIAKFRNGLTHSYQASRVSSNPNYTDACVGTNEWLQNADESQVQILLKSRCLRKNVTRLRSRFVINHRAGLRCGYFANFTDSCRESPCVYMALMAPDWRDRQAPGGSRQTRLGIHAMPCHAQLPFGFSHSNAAMITWARRNLWLAGNLWASFIVYFFAWFVHFIK